VLSPADTVALAAAGVVAGLIGTAGGITSLLSYGVLVWLGLPPRGASVANTIALAACLPGSMLTSRTELRGAGRWLGRWAGVAVVGGLAGAALLLSTPPGDFGRVVAPLLVVASLTLVVQPRADRWLARRAGDRAVALMLPPGLVLLSVYNGYFGAGSGVLMLTLLLLTVDRSFVRANALKNVLGGIATVVPAVAFVMVTSVDWSAVVPLAAGLFAGSLLGPPTARHLPAGLLRALVALTGVALAVQLWLDHG
jgi:uncharacterized membrane protein YfcA